MLDAPLLAETLLSATAGSAVGLLTGLVPGLHPNNLSQAALAGRGLLLSGLGVALVGGSSDPASAHAAFAVSGFLLGAALGHAFTDEIPAVFLGAPDPETALSVLPGHRLLIAGLGPAAVRAAATGTLLGVLFSLPLVPLLAAVMGPPGNFYGAVQRAIPFLLIGVALALVWTEQGNPGASRPRFQARLLALGVLVLAGALGELVVFAGLPFPGAYPLGAPPGFSNGHMLSLFAGLFGLPTLLLSARSSVVLPTAPAVPARLPLGRRSLAGAAALGTVSGAVVGWLPGVGAAQAAVLSKFARDRLSPVARGVEREGTSPAAAAEFLVMQSAVGAANLVFNLVALFSLLRARSGTMAAIEQAGGGSLERWDTLAAPPALLLALFAAALVSLPLCYASSLVLGRACGGFYARLPPRALALSVLIGILGLIAFLEGPTGLAVAGCAIALGLVPPLAGVKRVHLMGAILLPVAVRLLSPP